MPGLPAKHQDYSSPAFPESPPQERGVVLAVSQQEYPWRETTRTISATIIAGSLLGPPIFTAVTIGNPGGAAGSTAIALGIYGAFTRIMSIPGVNAFVKRFIPWLAAATKPTGYPRRRW